MNRRFATVVLGLCGLFALGLIAALHGPAVQAAGDLDGKTVFMEKKCNMCHAVPSQGIEAKIKSEAMKGPDVANLEADPDWIAKYLRQEEQKDGKDHKKGFEGTDEELKALVAWLLEQKAE
jgi:cytochrome c5